MQESIHNMLIGTDKKFILDSIKGHYKFKNNADFARFLGITPQSLSNWYTRNTFDYDILYSKCDEIDPDWLHTGKGEMLRKYRKNLEQALNEKENQIQYLSERLMLLEEQLKAQDDSGLTKDIPYKKTGRAKHHAADKDIPEYQKDNESESPPSD